MISTLQKRAAQAIINVFETGSARGDYSNVTLLPGDAGHLTYGRSQTTLASGNLFLLLKAYCEEKDALFASQIKPFLPRLRDIDLSLDRDMEFRLLLRRAGEDEVMRQVQDAFFDRVYWQPALASAARIGIISALGTAIVYDSHVHGSWSRLRDRTTSKYGTPQVLGEKKWATRYVEVRREWLSTHPNTLLRRTVYRLDAFRVLISQRNWNLELPFSVRGVLISEAVLQPTTRVETGEVTPRLLLLREPRMQGADVREVQAALKRAGIVVVVDGDFGPRTQQAVQEFQRRRDLKADGIVGRATRAALGLD